MKKILPVALIIFVLFIATSSMLSGILHTPKVLSLLSGLFIDTVFV